MIRMWINLKHLLPVHCYRPVVKKKELRKIQGSQHDPLKGGYLLIINEITKTSNGYYSTKLSQNRSLKYSHSRYMVKIQPSKIYNLPICISSGSKCMYTVIIYQYVKRVKPSGRVHCDLQNYILYYLLCSHEVFLRGQHIGRICF